MASAELGLTLEAPRKSAGIDDANAAAVAAGARAPSVGAAAASGAVIGLTYAVVGEIQDAAARRRREEAEAAIKPVREALAGQDPGVLLREAVQRTLPGLDWLPNQSVEPRVGLGDDQLKDEIAGGSTHTLLVVQVEHRLGQNFEQLLVRADVKLWPRASPEALRKGQVRPIYSNVLVVSVMNPLAPKLSGWTEKVVQGRFLRAWAADGGHLIRRSVDGAISELARMVAYDLADAPPASRVAAPYESAPIPQGGGRTWTRLRTGPLVSDGPPYPEGT